MSVVTFDYMNEYEHLSSTEVLMHSHVYYEITYYYSGMGKVITKKNSYNYRPNTYFLCKSNLVHGEVHHTETEVRCVGFLLHNSSLLIENGLYEDGDKSILEVLEKVKYELSHHKAHYNVMLDLIASELVITHMRLHHADEDKFDQTYYIVHLIDSNFNQNISTETMVSLSGYSYHHFRHLFKQKTGFSPQNYIIHKRLDHAKKLLTETSKNISNIAQACGFCSSSQFSMLFKKQEDMTPSNFRKKHHDQTRQKHAG